MRVEGTKPANFSGLPLILLGFSFLLIIGVPRLAKDWWYISLVGWLFLAASWGTSVEVEGETLRLKYAFGKLTINVPLSEIEDVKVVSKLERAVMIREFPELYVLITASALFVFLDLLLLPSGLLEGYYFGDIGLIFFGVLYLAVMSLPFNRINIAFLFGVLDLFFATLLMKLKMGYVDPVSVLIWGVLGLLFVAEYYRKDYVVITAQRGKYPLMAQKPEVLLKSIIGGVPGEA
ncbi:hypothetical protein [Palaeococcus ferrophilus]|uniref:hypothetical protein n=1 Tax=Palaeococcus ferrophilus TaxID=83868 RepID=UPI00064EEB03|nr:hypothetical protein [Palaeococcus ferrophilus]